MNTEFEEKSTSPVLMIPFSRGKKACPSHSPRTRSALPRFNET